MWARVAWMMCRNPDVFLFREKKGYSIHWPILSVHQRICPPAAKESSQNVCFDLPVHSVQQYARWTWQAPHITFLASIFTPFQPSNNLPQTMAVNAKEADKEKQGPIYQHRSDSSSFIGDKKRTAVHLSFAETGKTGICAQRPPLDHSLSKKTSEKVALCQELSRAASQGPKHRLPTQSVI